MALSQSECDRISELFDTDYDKGFSDLINVIKMYTKTYKDSLTSVDSIFNEHGITSVDSISYDNFLRDTKLVFLLIYKMFVVAEMIEEVKNELRNTSNPTSVKECNDYLIFVKNLESMKILLEGSDLCMKKLEDNETLMNEIIYYLEERNKSMQELTDTFKSFNNTLENLANTLGNLVDSSSKK